MTIRCEIVTPERTVFSEDVDYVSLPGIEGTMGIMPQHTPLLTVLRFGEVYIRAGSDEQFFAVGGGFAEVQPDKVIVLADSADRADDIDVQRAEEARARAQKLMEEGVPDDPEQYRAIENALRVAQLQINIRNKRANQIRKDRPPQFSND